MTIVLRPASPPSLIDLGPAGVVRAAVGEVVAAWGRGPWRVEYLTGHLGDKTHDDGRTEDAPRDPQS